MFHFSLPFDVFSISSPQFNDRMLRRTNLKRIFTLFNRKPRGEKTTKSWHDHKTGNIAQGGGPKNLDWYMVLARRVVYLELHHWVILGIAAAVSWMMVAPTIRHFIKSILNLDEPMIDTSGSRELMSRAWWQNKWQSGMEYEWKKDEWDGNWVNTHVFWQRNFNWLQQSLGRDIIAEARAAQLAVEDEQKSIAEFIQKYPNKDPPKAEKKRLRALVPMCGDHPIVWHLVKLGFDVDAVDFCETPLAALTHDCERELSHIPGAYGRLKLHLSDFFSASLWTGQKLAIEGYDLVYDRKASSSLHPSQHDDFSFLLKRCVKPETGVIFVEGMFRSARSKGANRSRGPPFHFITQDVQNMFPEDEYLVKCDEPKELRRIDLDAEARVTGRVPEWLLNRAFPCAVAKKHQEA